MWGQPPSAVQPGKARQRLSPAASRNSPFSTRPHPPVMLSAAVTRAKRSSRRSRSIPPRIRNASRRNASSPRGFCHSDDSRSEKEEPAFPRLVVSNECSKHAGQAGHTLVTLPPCHPQSSHSQNRVIIGNCTHHGERIHQPQRHHESGEALAPRPHSLRRRPGLRARRPSLLRDSK